MPVCTIACEAKEKQILFLILKGFGTGRTQENGHFALFHIR